MVEKLALLGPMGYSGALNSIIRITLSQIFPLKPIQDATFKWAFGTNPVVESEFGSWFQLILSGLYPVKGLVKIPNPEL